MAKPFMRGLFEGSRYIDEYVDFAGDLSQVTRIAHQGFDLAIHFHRDPIAYELAFLADIPRRIGIEGGGNAHFLTDSFPYLKAEGKKHEAEYCADLLSLVGISHQASLAPGVEMDREVWRHLSQKGVFPFLGKIDYAVVNPTSSKPHFRWPVQNFVDVCKYISCTFDLPVVLIGDNGRDRTVARMEKELTKISVPFFNLAGETSLPELAWVLRRARIQVTEDSGPAHLGAAVGCPGVTVFGRNEPQLGVTRWRPLGDNQHVVASTAKRKRWEPAPVFWWRSFSSVSKEEVLACVKAVLSHDRQMSLE